MAVSESGKEEIGEWRFWVGERAWGEWEKGREREGEMGRLREGEMGRLGD